MKNAPISIIKRYRSKIKTIRFLIGKLLGLVIPNSFVDWYIRYCKKYDVSNSSYFVATDHYGMREWQPKGIMADYQLHKFEDTELFIMSGYKENLKRLYGDYMKLPPAEKRVNHGTVKFYWKDK